MSEIPSVDLAVRISKIINRNKNKLKEYQDHHGKVNFNLLLGMILGSICSFEEKPMLNKIIKLFSEAILFNSNNQFKEFANLVIGMNNYLTDVLDTNPNNIHVLDNNKWVLSIDAELEPLYALWHAFFGIMKVSFEQEKSQIEKMKSNPVAEEALTGYAIMHKIMTAPTLSPDDLSIIQDKFPKYAQVFNNLRKLMFMQTITPQSTIH